MGHSNNDTLYIMENDERIKFAERALLRISRIIFEDNGALFLNVSGRRHKIPEKF